MKDEGRYTWSIAERFHSILTHPSSLILHPFYAPGTDTGIDRIFVHGHEEGVIMRTTYGLTLVFVAIAIATTNSSGQNQRAHELAGTSWKLVKLQGGDEMTSVPDDGSKYTITFGSNGRVTARVDCNRGGSTWRSTRANELEFGSWSMTRAKCPPGSLYDRVVTEGAHVKSYSIKNGNLFLSGMAAGGYYELEPLYPRRPH